ncbi:hypothetical protein WKH57_25795 [Niallia taxi]|uniref:hypothetical protein n=1 Tax=Niallia taxi TaxID=2499688 RepID=UPI00316CFA65
MSDPGPRPGDPRGGTGTAPSFYLGGGGIGGNKFSDPGPRPDSPGGGGGGGNKSYDLPRGG